MDWQLFIALVTGAPIMGISGWFVRRLLKRIEFLEGENAQIKVDFVRQIQFDRYVDKMGEEQKEIRERLDRIILLMGGGGSA